MSKICKNCGEILDDESVYCFKCKHNPDEVWTEEDEAKAKSKAQKQAKNKKTKRIILAVVAVVVAASIAFGIIFSLKSCNSIYRKVKVGGATVQLKSFSQENRFIKDEEGIQVPKTIVTLRFDVNGWVYGSTDSKLDVMKSESKLRIFAYDIRLDGAEPYDCDFTRPGASKKITALLVRFIAAPGYKVTEKKIFIPHMDYS